MTILAETAAAVTSSVVANVLDSLTGRSREERRQRHQAAERLIAALYPLVNELRLFETRHRPKKWKKLIRRVYVTLDELEPVLPSEWRHLKHSIRDSIGNAVGGDIIFVDLMVVQDDTELDPPSRWTMHAADYWDEICRAIRRWGVIRSARGARRMRLSNYDNWVRLHRLPD
jgi:hypothetical protein